MKKVPIFNYIAYPRSGSHFIHQVLSLYTGYHVPTNLYKPDHDRDLKKRIKGCFYIWRNPVKVLYSLWAAEFCYENKSIDFSNLNDKWLLNEINKIKKHFEFYWENAGIVIRYKDLMDNKAWKDILEFFKLDFNEEKIIDCSSKITPVISTDNYPGPWMNSFMFSDEYKEGRKHFEKQYEEDILESFSIYLNKDFNYLKQL